jgi:O-antigen/teichoic acid export membrane protein
MPSLAFGGLREIVGFSIFSFLTYAFHKVQREAGTMILAAQFGPTCVAYLGTPDNVAQRLHVVVASGSETLMPRFSANRDLKTAQSLFRNGTWASLVISLVFLLPLVVLLPDFLRLWISPEFARESAAVGQLVALSYISQGAYAPAATFFRGTNRPGLVTIVIFCAGGALLVSCLLLIPRFGLLGVGYAYLIGSVPALLGLVHCWFHMFGRASMGGLMRVVALPVALGGIVYAIGHAVHAYFGELTWIGLFTLGGSLAALTAGLIFAADWMLGAADAPSKGFLGSIAKSNKVLILLKYLPLKRARPVAKTTRLAVAPRSALSKPTQPRND